jgi:hypothetical protein
MAKKKTADATTEPNKALVALMSGKKLTASHLKTLRTLGESIIDAFLVHVGVEDPASRTDKNRWRHLRLESAEGIAGMTEQDGQLYLHVEAVIMKMPSDRDLIQGLMREALELNCTLPGACSIGIRGSQLVASATENMRSLRNPEEFATLIHTVMALANTLDDGLQAKYGGTTKTRKQSSDGSDSNQVSGGRAQASTDG